MVRRHAAVNKCLNFLLPPLYHNKEYTTNGAKVFQKCHPVRLGDHVSRGKRHEEGWLRLAGRSRREMENGSAMFSTLVARRTPVRHATPITTDADTEH